MTLTRRSVALLVVAAVLALLNLWDARDVATVESLPALPAVPPDDVAVVQITTPVEKLRIERVAPAGTVAGSEGWRIVTPLQFGADTAQVRALLRAFEPGLPMDAAVDVGNLEAYGVDDQNGRLVELFAAGADEPLVGLVVGKPASASAAFVRIPGSDAVYRAEVGGGTRYSRPAAEWRDRVALELDPEQVTGLAIARGGERLAFARDPAAGEWRLDGAPFAIDADTVTATVKLLARVRALEIHNPDYAAGFDAPDAVATLRLADGSTRALTLGGRVEANAAFVKIDGRDEVFRVPVNLRRALVQPLDAFRDRRLFAFARADVAALAYAEGGLTVVLAQTDDARWTVTQPPNMDADQQLANAVAETLSTLRADALVPDAGFSPTGARFEVRFRDGRTQTLELGPAEGDGARVRVRVSGKDDVFLLRAALLAELRSAFGRG